MKRGAFLGAAIGAGTALVAACTFGDLDGLTGGTPDAAAPDGSVTLARPDAGVAADATAPSGATAFDAYRAAVLADHPVAYYHLGDPGPTVHDEMGQHDGVYMGTPQHADGAMSGDDAGAFRGDGTVWIQLDDDPFPFAANAPYSLEAWISPESAPTIVGIIGRISVDDNGNAVDGYSLFLDQGSLTPTMSRWHTGTGDTAGSGTLKPDRYVHVVGTYDGTTMRVFVNGSSMASGDGSHPIIAASTHTTIGATRGGTFGFFQGAIDEAAIYDYALPPEKIAAHFEASGR